MGQTITFDSATMSIMSHHRFKPNENFLQTDYGWVVYIKETMPAELVQYIDKDSVYVYASKPQNPGEPYSDNLSKFKVELDDNGQAEGRNHSGGVCKGHE